MVATPDKQHLHPVEGSEKSDRVAVLLMGYGEVESYEDFANYNEQALNLLTAKFAPVPTWVYPPLAKLLAIFDLHEWQHQHDHFISPHNHILNINGLILKKNYKKNGAIAFKFLKPLTSVNHFSQNRF